MIVIEGLLSQNSLSLSSSPSCKGSRTSHAPAAPLALLVPKIQVPVPQNSHDSAGYAANTISPGRSNHDWTSYVGNTRSPRRSPWGLGKQALTKVFAGCASSPRSLQSWGNSGKGFLGRARGVKTGELAENQDGALRAGVLIHPGIDKGNEDGLRTARSMDAVNSTNSSQSFKVRYGLVERQNTT